MKPDFDLEHVYDEQIAPLMSKIIDICKDNNLPMFATFLYAHDGEEEGGQLCTTSLLFKERMIPDAMMELPKNIVPIPAPALRIRVRDKTGAVTKEEVIFP